MKRVAIACLLALVSVPALAQKTPAPFVLQQYFDNNGDPLAEGGMCVFAAGTSTLATSYTTAAGSVANANPLLFDDAGRPSSNGFFLTPGVSYKLELRDFTGVALPSCTIPGSLGVTIWTQDHIEATPGSASAVDVTGTAGESIAAGDAVFLSNGAGGLNPGQWYRTDSDLTYRSVLAQMVGVAPDAIGTGSNGTIRISGAVTFGTSLAAGSAYYADSSPGAMTVTPPTNALRVGMANSASVFIVGYMAAPVAPRGPPCGRLTLTSGLPVTINDVTAATTVYYTPAGSCNTISLYDGVAWGQIAFAELSIAVPASANTAYDVFAYDNSGTVALELTAWSSLTARATAIELLNGVYVKTGARTRRLLGSFRTTGVSGQTEDSVTKRYVSNLENRVPRALLKVDATASWNYSTATIRCANTAGACANQVEVFVTVQDLMMDLVLTGAGINSTGVSFAIGIGEDSTTTFATAGQSSGNVIGQMVCRLSKMPAIGGHTYSWNEWSAAVATTTFYGTSGDSTPAGTTSGLRGWIEG